MTLTTSKGKTYEARYVDGPTLTSGTVLARIKETRALAVVAQEFDGLESFGRESENQGNKEWTGYSELRSIRRVTAEEVLVELAKP